VPSRFTKGARVAASGMAFKLTYSDGQATDYDDSTNWEVENGVVKLGREAGKWTVLVSPSHWATLELDTGKKKEKDHKHKDHKHKDHTDDKHKDQKDEKHKDDEDDDKEKDD
jgi:hypothetical protein